MELVKGEQVLFSKIHEDNTSPVNVGILCKKYLYVSNLSHVSMSTLMFDE